MFKHAVSSFENFLEQRKFSHKFKEAFFVVAVGPAPFHYVIKPVSVIRDRAEGGAGGALAPPLFCKNGSKFNEK